MTWMKLAWILVLGVLVPLLAISVTESSERSVKRTARAAGTVIQLQLQNESGRGLTVVARSGASVFVRVAGIKIGLQPTIEEGGSVVVAVFRAEPKIEIGLLRLTIGGPYVESTPTPRFTLRANRVYTSTASRP